MSGQRFPVINFAALLAAYLVVLTIVLIVVAVLVSCYVPGAEGGQ